MKRCRTIRDTSVVRRPAGGKRCYRRLWAAALLAIASCAGEAGPGGANSLVRIDSEDAGANCSDGGLAIHTGLDENENGVLDNAEIVSTTYLCEEAPGGGGQVLVRIDEEPAGANCVAGGVAIHVGRDQDHDGALDDEEIESSSYVCDGEDGEVALVRFDEEPPGPNCAAGGVAVNAGVDVDDDGVLDDTEITSTSFVCDAALGDGGVLDGDFTIENEFDVLVLSTYSGVTGKVEVGSGGPASLAGLDGLLTIGGHLDLRQAFNLSDLDGLGGLVSIGEQLFVGSSLSTIRLPSLESAGGLSFNVGSVGTVDLPALTSGSSFLSLSGPAQALNVPSLVEVAGSFSFANSPVGESIVAGSLEIVGGYLQISNVDALLDLSGLANLQTVAGGITIQNNDALIGLGLSALTDAGPSLTIRDNPMLPTCQAEGLRDQLFAAGWSGTVVISGNDDAATCP